MIVVEAKTRDTSWSCVVSFPVWLFLSVQNTHGEQGAHDKN